MKKHIGYICLLVGMSLSSGIAAQTPILLTGKCTGDETFVLQAGQTGDVYKWYKDNNEIIDSTRNELVVKKTDVGTYTCKVYELDPNIGKNMMPNGGFDELESSSCWVTMSGNSYPQPFSSAYRYFNDAGFAWDKDTFYVKYPGESGFFVITENASKMWKRYVDVGPDDGQYYALFDAASEGNAWYTHFNDYDKTDPQKKSHILVQNATYVFSFSAMNINSHEADTVGLGDYLEEQKENGKMVIAIKMPSTTDHVYWIGEANDWNYANPYLSDYQFTQIVNYPGWWYCKVPTATTTNTGVIAYGDQLEGHNQGGAGGNNLISLKENVTRTYFAYFKPQGAWSGTTTAEVKKGTTTICTETVSIPSGSDSYRLCFSTKTDLTGATVKWFDSNSHTTAEHPFVSNGFYDGDADAAANPDTRWAFTVDDPNKVTMFSFTETDNNAAVLHFTITNNATGVKATLGEIDLDCHKNPNAHTWNREQYIWTCPWNNTTNFTIAVEDKTTSVLGNDFALDRIMFQMVDNENMRELSGNTYVVSIVTPSAELSADPICETESSFVLKAASIIGTPTYSFDLEGNTYSGTLNEDNNIVLSSALNPGKYSIDVTLENTETNCNNTISFSLTVLAAPKQLKILDWSEDVCASVTSLPIHFETDGLQYSYALLKQEAGVPTYDNAAWSAYEDLKDTTFMLDISSCEKDIRYTIHLRVKSECDIQTPVYSDFIWHSNRTGETTAVACGAFVWYGVEYTTTQKVTHTFTSVETGCDSIVTLDLTITPVDEHQDTTVYWCGSYTWYGHDYESPCDTMVYFMDDCYKRMLHLKTLPVETIIDTVACGVFDWSGTTYHQSQTIVETLESGVTHCDSVVTLHLTVLNDSLMYTKWGNLVLCADRNRNLKSYQWYINGVEVPGETGQYMLTDDMTALISVRAITQSGDTLYSCEKTFAEMTTSPDQSKEEYILPKNVPVRVYSVNGHLIRTAEGSAADIMAHLPAGVYILRTEDKSIRFIVY